MATVLPDIFDVPDAGQSGEFSIYARGVDVYLAVIANKGDGGRLMLRRVGGGLTQDLNLGPLGVTGALSVRLDGSGGRLVAYIKRVIDTDGQDRGRRVITPIDTGIPIGGGGDTPVTPPAPPGGAIDLSPLLQAIQSAHDGIDATYNRTSLILDVMTKVDPARIAAAVRDFRTPAWEDDGLPPELLANLGSQWQRDLAFTVITLLEYLLRLDAFPKADGGTIIRT